MSTPTIRLACGPYDRTSAIVHGQVGIPGIDLEVVEMTETAEMFASMAAGKYDASEMSLAELVYRTSRGPCDFIGIPVFPSRVFRHGFIFYNRLSNIRRPEDLTGKKLGFANLIQTASVWIRGMLLEEFGIAPEQTELYVATLRHAADNAPSRDLRTPEGSIIHQLERRGKNAAETVALALQEGHVDAICTTRITPAFGTDRNLKRLFEHYRSAEIEYFKKTKIFPIMHVLVVQKSAIEKHPDLPTQLFNLFSESKQRAYEWQRNPSSMSIVWHGSYLEDEQKIFPNDPWAYGLAENAHVIEKFLAYCSDLGTSERRIEAKDLFSPSTWTLREETRASS